MADLSKTYLFRMTHVDNIPHVLLHGITHAQSANANHGYVPIGDSSLISTRSSFVLANGKNLGDYIPFYFGVRTPMLYVMQKGFNWVAPTAPQDIVYCVSSVQKILDHQLDFVFTDGHAVDGFTTQYNKGDLSKIDELIDWQAVHAKFWKSETDLDLKRRKEAEFLVLQDVPLGAILGYIVYNEEAKNKLMQWGVPDQQVHIKSQYYF